MSGNWDGATWFVFTRINCAGIVSGKRFKAIANVSSPGQLITPNQLMAMEAAKFGHEAGNATVAILWQNLPIHNFARNIER